ncbi:hypothetical protein [Acinetobacter nosocomialis]|uniref:hypothetical protein n=1 Tax=Acinetobacter nosocomialis TaxID=106654 RepID=UPI00124FC208|nr:hypothetical protein [Acinetobacter nosocomialis]
MNELMSDWLSNNWSVILKSYPEAEPLLYYFNTVAWVNPIIDIIKRAIRGEGANIQETSAYLLMDDVVDEGHIIDAVEFYFNGEFDGKVPFKVFASVLELIVLAYAEHNSEEKERIIHLIPRLKKVYAI